MEPSWWLAAPALASLVVGLVVGRWRYRSSQQETGVQYDTAAFEGYDELVAHYRAELTRVESALAALRADHLECAGRLTTAERALEDLRGDLNVLKGLVVTQIQAEADKDQGAK